MADMTVFNTFAPYAQQLQRETGIPASITLAQLVQESGWNLSELAKTFKNPFGVKWSVGDSERYVMLPTTEEVNGVKKPVVAPFKIYNSYTEAFNDRAKFLSQPRYRNLWGLTDPNQYADNLQQDGYATDSSYSANLKSLISSFGLKMFDQTAGGWGALTGTPPEGAVAGLPPLHDTSVSAQSNVLQTLAKVGIYGGLGIVIVVAIFKMTK